MERNKLTSAKSIKSYLEGVIQETLDNVKKSKLHQTALDEKDKQDSLAADLGGDEGEGEEDDLAAALGDAGAEEKSTDGKEQPKASPDKGNDDDSAAMAEGDVTFDDIVDKLNTIRSGKSFKDSAIKDAFEKYVDDLDDAERTALFAFLKGIAQIVTGEIPGDKATEPAEDPASVQMKKEPDATKSSTPVQKKSIKPNVIRTPGANAAPEEPQKHAGTQKKPKGGVEDTSGPSPIVPKRRGA